ncbi:MAG: GAF domain-containing protein [Melioribacteraceae bacterium]|nr:GAF domain-containing protein [Melioribacteraceae bacterium]
MIKNKNEFYVDYKTNENSLVCDLNLFPFETKLSFVPLIKFWETALESDNSIVKNLTKDLFNEINKKEEFSKPIEDLSVLKKNDYIIETLMSAIYPSSQLSSIISVSVPPFKMEPFYATPTFEEFFKQNWMSELVSNVKDSKKLLMSKIISAYSLILQKLYGIHLDEIHPMQAKVIDKESGLGRYYQLILDPRFVDVETVGELPKIDEDKLKDIKRDIWNFDKWKDFLDPKSFIITGLSTVNFVDVTEQQTLSLLRHELLDSDAISSFDRVKSIRDKLRTLTNMPNIRIGLVAFPSTSSSFFKQATKIGESFILQKLGQFECSDMAGSVYDVAFQTKKPVIIECLESYEGKTIIEEEILGQDIKNLMVVPLLIQNSIVGFLEVGSKTVGEINQLTAMRFQKIYSLFATILDRSLKANENKIQAIIKEKCTSLHSSVEWKFQEAAYEQLAGEENEKISMFEEIVFEGVYPLFGVSDIRDSSMHRNRAIQDDLLEHLEVVKDILKETVSYKSLPYLDELSYRTGKIYNRIKNGLNSGDEISTIDFLQNEIVDVFEHIRNYDPVLDERVADYLKLINPHLRIFYKERKSYEDSVNQLNDAISGFVDEAENAAQEMYPHYFEKYKTDGIEHSIYIGQSIAPTKQFSKMYLQNLRLWQLILTCGIALKAEKLKSSLPIPLELTHLILVQNAPLAIRFRTDEKKFDVDGTYNIRYEIMKKRIDKALIKGTEERLTQPGKIAVIYSQTKEKLEYKKYIEYLQAHNYLNENIEELELQDLQGVQGLKALRVDVNMNTDADNIIHLKNRVDVSVNELGNIV